MFEQPTPATSETLEVILDGQLVRLPAERRSITAIRAYLETIALETERVLCSFKVDTRPVKSSQLPGEIISHTRVEAQTVALTDMPLRMLESALRETTQARTAVEHAVTLVLINDGITARELWWELTRTLKEPLLTLSLLPETIYQPIAGTASLLQMRKWQLQQLATIIKDVDDACWTENPEILSNALESRALPWLDKLQEAIRLLHQTVLVGARLRNIENRDVDQRSLYNR